MKRMLPRVDRATRKLRRQVFEARCRELKIPLASQSRVILMAALDRGSHPAAEDVFASPAFRRAWIFRAPFSARPKAWCAQVA